MRLTHFVHIKGLKCFALMVYGKIVSPHLRQRRKVNMAIQSITLANDNRTKHRGQIVKSRQFPLEKLSLASKRNSLVSFCGLHQTNF